MNQPEAKILRYFTRNGCPVSKLYLNTAARNLFIRKEIIVKVAYPYIELLVASIDSKKVYKIGEGGTCGMPYQEEGSEGIYNLDEIEGDKIIFKKAV